MRRFGYLTFVQLIDRDLSKHYDWVATYLESAIRTLYGELPPPLRLLYEENYHDRKTTWNTKGRQTLNESGMKGGLQRITIRQKSQRLEGLRSIGPEIYMGLNLRGFYEKDRCPDFCAIQIPESYLRIHNVDANQYVESFVGLIDRNHLVSAFLDFELQKMSMSGFKTTFELFHNTRGIINPDLYTQLQGFFWGNMLNAQHVEALGGVDRITTRFPYSRIFSQDPLTVWLQASADIYDMTREAYRELYDFLSPVLPGPDKIDWNKVEGQEKDDYNRKASVRFMERSHLFFDWPPNVERLYSLYTDSGTIIVDETGERRWVPPEDFYTYEPQDIGDDYHLPPHLDVGPKFRVEAGKTSAFLLVVEEEFDIVCDRMKELLNVEFSNASVSDKVAEIDLVLNGAKGHIGYYADIGCVVEIEGATKDELERIGVSVVDDT